jgi:hypothetical protein
MLLNSSAHINNNQLFFCQFVLFLLVSVFADHQIHKQEGTLGTVGKYFD